MTHENVDAKTVEGFGQEWSAFDYIGHSERELRAIFEQYFAIFPWEALGPGARGFDAGCGSGRWANFVAPRVGHLHVVDASGEALAVARRMLSRHTNVTAHHASVGELPFDDSSMDFGYSLGVLHHVPDTAGALRACARKLKAGAPFLVYLYYALENRPRWFRALYRASDLMRLGISRAPYPLKRAVSEAIAAGVYLPLARASRTLEGLGADVSRIPLSAYRHRSFYVMRTDALDRFGTRLEQRFTKDQIRAMMIAADLSDVSFTEDGPFWCAVGIKNG